MLTQPGPAPAPAPVQTRFSRDGRLIVAGPFPGWVEPAAAHLRPVEPPPGAATTRVGWHPPGRPEGIQLGEFPVTRGASALGGSPVWLVSVRVGRTEVALLPEPRIPEPWEVEALEAAAAAEVAAEAAALADRLARLQAHTARVREEFFALPVPVQLARILVQSPGGWLMPGMAEAWERAMPGIPLPMAQDRADTASRLTLLAQVAAEIPAPDGELVPGVPVHLLRRVRLGAVEGWFLGAWQFCHRHPAPGARAPIWVRRGFRWAARLGGRHV